MSSKHGFSNHFFLDILHHNLPVLFVNFSHTNLDMTEIPLDFCDGEPSLVEAGFMRPNSFHNDDPQW